MQALTIVQNENNGSLTGELMQEVADHLQMPSISVQEVATFYENYNHKPVGKHIIRFCHNISCMLNGSDELISYLEQKLEVKTGEVSKDGLVSVKKVECLGACDLEHRTNLEMVLQVFPNRGISDHLNAFRAQ